METARFIIAAVFILLGLFVLGVATVGLFRLQYVLNRIHVSAKCDTLGTLLVLVGVAILHGFSPIVLKLAIIVVFMWLSNPVATYLIGRTEVLTNPYLEKECEVVEK